jgi:hypothetical protein
MTWHRAVQNLASKASDDPTATIFKVACQLVANVYGKPVISTFMIPEEAGSSETAVATRLHGAIFQNTVTVTHYVLKYKIFYLLSKEHVYLLTHGSYNSQNYSDYFPTLSHSGAHGFHIVKFRTPIQDLMQSTLSNSGPHAVHSVRLKAQCSPQCPIQDPMQSTVSNSGSMQSTVTNSGPHAVHSVRLKAPCSPECQNQDPIQSGVSDSRPEAVHSVQFRTPCNPQCPIQDPMQSTVSDARPLTV